jgi:hypothetical protein
LLGVSSCSLQLSISARLSSSSSEDVLFRSIGSWRDRFPVPVVVRLPERLPPLRAEVDLVGVFSRLSLLTLPSALRKALASFLMPRNCHWIPSGVDPPKYLAISIYHIMLAPFLEVTEMFSIMLCVGRWRKENRWAAI